MAPPLQLLSCPNHCEYQMRVKTLREEPGGVWRVAARCPVCKTELERSLPLGESSSDHDEMLRSLQNLLGMHRRMAAGE